METINNIESLLLEQIKLGKEEYIEDIVDYYNMDSQPDKIIKYLPKLIEQIELSIQNNSNNDLNQDEQIELSIQNNKLKKYYRLVIENAEQLDLQIEKTNGYIQKLIQFLWKDKNFYEFEQIASIGVQNHCEKSTIYLAYYYFKEGNFKLMDKCLLAGIKFGSVKCMYKYAYTLWVREKYDFMEQYVEMAIESSSLEILQTVFGYYYHIEKKYDLVKKYCEIGIKLNNVYCMYALGYYYYYIEKNYEMMEKYFSMGAENECLNSIYCLGNYYQFVKKDYLMMKHYYLMGIERKCRKCMNNMGIYYYGNKNYDLVKHYYNMSIELGYSKAMHNMANYYLHVEKNHLEAMSYYLKAIINELFYDFNHVYYLIDNEENNNLEQLEKFLNLINLNEKLVYDDRTKTEFDKIKLILHHKISIIENTDSILKLKRNISKNITGQDENFLPNKRNKE